MLKELLHKSYAILPNINYICGHFCDDVIAAMLSYNLPFMHGVAD